MKFRLQRSDFSLLIGKIQSIVPTKPSIPILSNILVEAHHHQIILSATDLTVSMKVCTNAHVEEEGAVTLPAKRLFQLVRELTTPDIQMETTSPETVVVRAGSSEFRIQGMHISEYPSLPNLFEGFEVSMKAETLKEMLMRTAFAAARDDSRQVLNGVLMQKASHHATFIGTDGKRLARNQVDLEDDSEESGSFILPLKAVDEVVKLLDDKEQKVNLTIMGEKLAIEAGSVVLITKLLSGQYPDVTRVIPNQSDKPIVLHRDELIALLRQVALFTSEGNNSVRFSFSDGLLNLRASSGEIGEGNVSMPVNYNGPKLEIAFNPHYFLDILRVCKDETVRFEVSDSYNPGLITDSSNAEFVIMPMRLEN